MSSKVKLNLVKYRCAVTGESVWFEQSMTSEVAEEVARLLARKGHKPTIFSVRVNPDSLISTAKVKRCRVVI